MKAFNRDVGICPGDIAFIIHILSSALPYPHLDSGTAQRSIQRFLRAELIKEDASKPSGYEVTGKGKAWIEALERVPFPEPHTTWVIPGYPNL